MRKTLSKVGIQGNFLNLIKEYAKMEWGRESLWSKLGGRSQDAEVPGEGGLTESSVLRRRNWSTIFHVAEVEKVEDRGASTPRSLRALKRAELLQGSLFYFPYCSLCNLELFHASPLKNKANQSTN